MTTLVKVSVDRVNVGPGKIVAGVACGPSVQTAVYDCPMKVDFWVHGDARLVLREATDQDLIESGGKSVPAAVEES